MREEIVLARRAVLLRINLSNSHPSYQDNMKESVEKIYRAISVYRELEEVVRQTNYGPKHDKKGIVCSGRYTVTGQG